MDILDKIKRLALKGSKPDRKKKLDSLKLGDTWFDPETGTRYECIKKLSNGESITVAKSLNIETI